jgi:hypothetical protein
MMNLGYMRRHLREMLKEPDPDNSLWTDLTLNEWLNEGAKMMTSSAQQNESACQFLCKLKPGSTTDYQREYILPDDFDEAISASLYNGIELALRHKDVQPSIRNNNFCGVPTHFYIRERTKKRIETDASGITITDIDSRKKARKMFGLDPRPTSAFPVTITYLALQPWMHVDSDEPTIPYEFRRGIIEYAAAQAFKSDEMYAQANLAMGEYSAYMEKLRDKMINRGQEMDFPTVKIRDEEDPPYQQYEVYRIP